MSRLPGRSPGLDGIPNEVVRLIAKRIPRCFFDRWNRQKIFELEFFSTDEKGKNWSLIDSTGKRFERLIHNRMEKVCEDVDNERISEAQFCFRKGQSTDHALKKVKERVSESHHELPSPVFDWKIFNVTEFSLSECDSPVCIH